jgi:hypothetical protein
MNTIRLKGTINSMFDQTIPDNSTICINIYLDTICSNSGASTSRSMKQKLIKSKEYQHHVSYPVPYFIDFEVESK